MLRSQKLSIMKKHFTISIVLALIVLHTAIAQELLPGPGHLGLWVPNASVNAMASQGDIVYVAGNFTQVTRSSPNTSLYDIQSGQYLPVAHPNNQVSRSISDGTGGFFVYGLQVSHFDQQAHRMIGRILPDGTVSSAFNPNFPGNPSIMHLVTSGNNRVYIYTSEGNPVQHTLHCLDYNGNILWSRNTNHRVINGVVDNGTLYVVGQFTLFEGQTRNRVAAINAFSGMLLPFQSNVQINVSNTSGFVQSNLINIGIHNDELFISYRGLPSLESRIIALNKNTGAALGWSLPVSVSTDGLPMLVHRGILYQGLSNAPGIIAIDCATKQSINLSLSVPITDNTIRAIAAAENNIYFSASRLQRGADELGMVAMLNMNTGLVTSLNMSTPAIREGLIASSIQSLAAFGTSLFVGGSFPGIETESRSKIYAFNKITNELLPLSLNLSESDLITKVIATSQRLYLQGYSESFTDVMVLDRTTGAQLNWPRPTNQYTYPILEQEAGTDRIYLAEPTSDVSCQLLRFDGNSGEFDASWNPTLGLSSISNLACTNNHIILSGSGATSNNPEVRFLDANSGLETSPAIEFENDSWWGAGNAMNAIEIHENVAYIGGTFTDLNINGVATGTRTFAAIDLTSGNLINLGLTFSSNSYISSLKASGGTLYLGGEMVINNNGRSGVTALNLETNQLTPWFTQIFFNYSSPAPPSIEHFGDGIYVGSLFSTLRAGTPSITYRHPCLVKLTPDRSNRISGRVFYDDNQNGVQDAGENGIPNLLIGVQPGNIFYPTNSSGDYTAYAGTGDIIITPVHPNYTLSVSPNSREINFANYHETSAGNNFGIYIQQNTTDMSVTLASSRRPSPGFYMDYIATITNNGTTASSGTLLVELDNRLLFQSASTAPTGSNNNSFTFDYAGIEPGHSQTFTIHVRVPVPTAEGSLLGQVLSAAATVSPALADYASSDNHSSFDEPVIGSFDPNDKLVTPAGDTPNGYIAENTEFLEYTIRFQNMGNAPAEFVTITDQLDTDLDVSSFTFVAASHPQAFEIVNGVLSITFNNIQLPPEEVDEPGSHGYFTYRINLNDNLPRGTVVNNSASIVFDYNLPIETNTTINTLLDPPYSTTVSLPRMTGVRESDISFPLQVNDFNSILGQQFSIAWDANVVTLQGIEQFGLPGMTINNFNTDHASDGYITYAWSDPTSTAQSLPNSSALFVLRFALTGAYGASTPIAVTNAPTVIEAINQDFETIAVERVDGAIEISADLTIDGTVTYPNGQAVQNTMVHVSGSQIAEQATNADGGFSITVQPADENASYTITPSKTNDPNLLNGIDVQDVALIRRHILRTELFNSPYQFIAADVSNNYNISIQDLAIVQALILGVQSNFPNGRQWTFLDAGYEFASPLSPFPYPQSVTPSLATLEHGESVDFIAVKIGDVNLNRDNSQNGRAKIQEVVLELGNIREAEDGTAEIDVRAFGFVDISAYQFTVNWNAGALQWQQHIDQSVSQMNGIHEVANGYMTSVWDEQNGGSLTLDDGSILFTLKFNTLMPADSTPLTINNSRTPLRMYNKNLQPVNVTIKASSDETKLESGVFYPNPFNRETNISFTAMHEHLATFDIMDVTGKIIYSEEIAVTKGYNEKTIKGETFVPGVYLFKLRLRDKMIKGKIVKSGN